MMNKFLFLFLTLFSLNAFAENKEGVIHDAVITRVVDGDTVGIEANWLPDPLKKELLIRVYGVDTPEKGFRAKCEKENKKGLDATNFTKKMLKSSTNTQILLYDWDKYGGRVLGDVIIDGKSLRNELINNGFAREYYGKAKSSWCK